MGRFSKRHGFEPPEPEITITHDAPHNLRGIIVDIAYEAGLDPYHLRAITCQVLRVREDPGNWSAFPNVDSEVRGHVDSCAWYEVYDIVESFYNALLKKSQMQSLLGDVKYRPKHFADEINKFFLKKGIGWQLVDGELRVRGEKAFENTLMGAINALSETDRPTAAKEIRQALNDLSQRPEADLTGALQHALAAVECVMRDVTGDSKATLGSLLSKHKGNIPVPLDQAVEKIWGFASEQGRHLREGKEPTQNEAELAVHVAAAVATYLAKKSKL
jgi:hypothetical protein